MTKKALKQITHTNTFSLFPPPYVVSPREDNTWAPILLRIQHDITQSLSSTAKPAVAGRQLSLPIYHGSTKPSSTLASTHISNRPRFSQSRCMVSQPVLLERVPIPPSICSPGPRRQQTVQPCNDDLGFVPPQKEKKLKSSTLASFSIYN